jgi:AAA+ ATPase superfamily predicted ATPase
MFVNRQRELGILDALYRGAGAQFVALYGRRRIGKTALLCHWLERLEGPGVYWVASRSSAKMLLARFSQALQPLTGSADPGFCFSSWEAAFQQLSVMARSGRVVVVMDEFPYLMESVPGIASILQAAWDHGLKSSRAMLVLCGSHYQMMHDELLSGRGALFGRTTADMLLEGIDPEALPHFLPRYSQAQIVETYSVIGGVPKYLEMWNDGWPVLRNVQDVILSPATIFRQEPAFLIQDEIADPRTYLAILEAIGGGLKNPTAIGEITGLPLPHVGRYLQTLLLLKFIRRGVSLDAPDLAHTRLSHYEIADPYLRFHFAFIRPHLALLEQNRLARVMDIVRARFDAYVGHTGYEELCRQTLIRSGDRGDLPFVPELVGRIWNREHEVDVAAINRADRAVLLGECKWTTRKMGPDELAELERKGEAMKRLKDYKKHYALFSKSGFTAPFVDAVATRKDVRLFEGLTAKKLTRERQAAI